jgi:hypothetical protein
MSGASPASYSTGGSPQTYIPTAQPAGDASYQNILGFGSGGGGGFGPAASQVPSINPAYQAYLSASGLYPQAVNAYATDIANPYSGQAIQGGLAGADIFNSQVYPALAGAPGALAGSSNALLDLAPALAMGASQASAPLQGVGSQILNTGFDPQSALYNQLAGQSRDAANVANAGAGIGGTPYGASVAANAQNNFNLNWQNQQLARQAQATQSAGQNQQNIASILGQAGNIFGAGLGAAGAGLANAGNIGTGLAQGTAATNQLPYQASLGIGNNQISGLGNLQSLLQGQANLGGQSFALPQQVLNDLQSYLQLSQAAQQQGLAGGQQGFNQLASGIGGGIAGANALFNPSTGLIPGVGSGISSLFGGAADTFGLGAAIPGALDTSGSGALLAAAPIAAGS